jgi:Protein of unknown function (DUF3108)
MIAVAMHPSPSSYVPARPVTAHAAASPPRVASASLRASAPALITTALLWVMLALALSATATRAAGANASEDVPMKPSHTAVARTLAPFTADYAAFRGGDAIGKATLRLVRENDGRWRVDLNVHADRGVAGMLGLDLQQSTLFEDHAAGWRPLDQSSLRKGLFLGKRTTGRYDWAAGSAQWSGDVKPQHRAPVPLRPGDLSGLLINLAIVRDAVPGHELQYRFVEGGRTRDHQYRVAEALERVIVDDLTYAAMRVERSNGGNDQTVVWVAEGVPTPVRILQREDGEDLFDLRLIAYQGA